MHGIACYETVRKGNRNNLNLTEIMQNTGGHKKSLCNEYYVTSCCAVFVSSGIPTVPGTVTLKKDSQNLIGISIGGGAQFCPCLYIVQVKRSHACSSSQFSDECVFQKRWNRVVFVRPDVCSLYRYMHFCRKAPEEL